MKTELAVIVPTKGRPQSALRLVDSLARTTQDPYRVVLVVNAAEVETYMRVFPRAATEFMVVPDDSTYPSKLNDAARVFSQKYPYLALFNDDHEAITHGWDVMLKGALDGVPFGIAYGNDKIWPDGTIPSAPVITSSMYAALGWVALPGLNHILVDNVWVDLARALGQSHFIPECVIEHHHYTAGTAEMDKTYQETSEQSRQDEDSKTYFTWLHEGGFDRAVATLRDLA